MHTSINFPRLVIIFFFFFASPVFASIPPSCFILTQGISLRPSLISPNVTSLQKLLNLDPDTQVSSFGAGSRGNETTKYGSGTFMAVRRFQEKYASAILTPSGLTRGTGLFGPNTKKKLYALYCTPTIPEVPSSTIVSRADSYVPSSSSDKKNPYGSFTSPKTDCIIAVSSSSCNITVSWNVYNSSAPSVTQDIVQFSTLPISLGEVRTLKYGVTTFILSDSSLTLNTVQSNATCTLGTTWNGSLCSPSIGSFSSSTVSGACTAGTSWSGSLCAVSSDTTAPSTPTSLTATAISKSQVDLSWTASTDTVGVMGYKIYRFGTQIATVPTNSYSNIGLSTNTAYSYTVSSYDAAGNNSLQSFAVSTTTRSITAFLLTSGSFTISTPSCTIATGASTCTIPVSWSITNPVSPSVRQNSTQFSTLATGSSISRTLSYGSSTFTLIDEVATLDTKVTTASCISGTVWNGTLCTPNSFIQAADFNSGKLKGFTTWDITQASYPFNLDKDLSDLAKTGANLIRVALVARHSSSTPMYTIENAQYASLDQVLLRAEKYNFKVVVVIAQSESRQGSYWSDTQAQNDYASLLKEVAAKYRNATTIAGFDIMNEPVLGLGEGQSHLVWAPIASNLVNQFRSVNTNHTIIIESADWGQPHIFYYMKPINPEDKNIVYSIHMYQPHSFTHQGLEGNPLGVYYPNATDTLNSIRVPLQYVLDFQKKYNVPIYVGEFSAIRWAPGDSRENYLRDLLTIFNENKWSWTYHSWRTWDGWDIEIPSSDPQYVIRTTTPGLNLLRAAFQGGSLSY